MKITFLGAGSTVFVKNVLGDVMLTPVLGEELEIALYDIDREAAEHNAVIGEKYNHAPGANSHWSYVATDTLEEALTGADFVVISILPGTFDEMESDVHTPEKYGIYQSVGDTAGPGGVIRALRTLWEDIPLAKMQRIPQVSNASVTVVRYEGDAATVVVADFCDHLAEKVTEKYIN